MSYRILLRTVRPAALAIVALTLLCQQVEAQLTGGLEDESRLYAESKQVNQFFRRFNGEEDEKGNRYFQGDKQFRNAKLRKKYLGILFDEQSAGMTDALKAEFAKDVLDRSAVLNFRGRDWFSEVQATFTLSGAVVPITLFMELEKAQLGYKWVISKVYCSAFDPYFVRDTTRVGRFLHPMSHELDFMNLRKAFEKSDSISQFTVRRFEADHLSVFLYEARKGTLKFKSVDDVKFHFFQIPGWYFQVSNFNRAGYNTGWLISNLMKLEKDSDREIVLRYLYK